MAPIGVAIIGSGIFVKEQHIVSSLSLSTVLSPPAVVALLTGHPLACRSAV